MSIKGRLESLEKAVKPNTGPRVHELVGKIFASVDAFDAFTSLADRMESLDAGWPAKPTDAGRRATDADPEVHRLADRVAELTQ